MGIMPRWTRSCPRSVSAFVERRISSQIWPLAPPVDVMLEIIEVQCEMNVKDESISVKDSVKIYCFHSECDSQVNES